MTQDEEIEFDRLKTARDSLLLTVANLRGMLETIAADEREACANIAENWNSNGFPRVGVAAQIRARGKA